MGGLVQVDNASFEPKRRNGLPHMVSAPTSGSRLVGIEGLRGIAAISVLVAHVRVHLAHSVDLGILEPAVSLLGQGLTLFFALSGFLLYRPWVSFWLEGKPYPKARLFLANRALRIYPAYIAILLLVSLALGVAYTESIPTGRGVQAAESTVGFMTDPLLLLLNLTLTHTLIPLSIKTGLGVSWSLTVEVAFYLVLPLLGLLLLKVRKDRRTGAKRSNSFVFVPPLILAIVGLTGKLIMSRITGGASAGDQFYLNWGANWTAVFARSLLAHADLFAFGMIAAVIIGWERSGKIEAKYRRALTWGSMGIIILSVLAAKATSLDDTFFALASAALIVLVCTRDNRAEAGLLARIMELLPLRFIGLISYSLYLWHIPVIWFLKLHNMTFSESMWWANAALVFLTSSALATITYYLVEVPALRLKRKTTTRSRPEAQRSATERVQPVVPTSNGEG